LKIMRWFRRHQAQLMAAAAVMLMLSWGLGGYLSRLVDRADDVAGWIDGQPIGRVELQEASGTLELGTRLWFLEPEMRFAVQFARGSDAARKAGILLATDFFGFVVGDEGQRVAGDEALWRCAALLAEVRREGVLATPAEASELLAVAPLLQAGGISGPEAFAQVLRQWGLSEADVTLYVGNLVRIGKLIALRRAAVLTSTPEVWARYVHENEQVRLRLVELDASLFLPIVEFDEEDLKRWHGEHLDQPGDPAAGVVGYLAPRRAKIECAVAPLERLQDEAVVTDEEVADYYEQNKHRFPAERPAAGDDSEEERAPGVLHRPLEEVRDEIVRTLKERKGLQAAGELVDTVVGELASVAADYVHEPLPLAQMARRHGLEHSIPSVEGRQFLSRQEAAAALPDGDAVAMFVFDEPDSLFDPQQFGRGSRPMVCQVLALREPEPLSYAEVEPQVRHDYGLHRAMESAGAFAEKLRAAADGEGLSPAAAEMEGRLRALLGESAPGDPLLRVQESGLFRRTAEQVEGLAAAGEDLVEAAFALVRDEAGVVTQCPPANRCFVFEVIERSTPSGVGEEREWEGFRVAHLYEKQGRELRRWMDGLMRGVRRAERAEE